MQKTQIIGRIGKDAEVKEISAGKVINFSVAVSEKWKDKSGQNQEKTTWYECAKFGESTGVAQYLKKSTLIYVEGNVSADAYLSNGEARAVLRLTVRQIELLSSKSENQSEQPKREPVQDEPVQEDDDLPF